MNALQEHNAPKIPPNVFVVPSVAANTSAIENVSILSAPVGRETDTLERARDATFYYVVRAFKALKAHLLEAELDVHLRPENRFLIVLSSFSSRCFSPLDSIWQPSIALSSESVDETSLYDCIVERLYSTTELIDQHDFETRPWRGTFHLSLPEKLICSGEVKLEMADLPRWKPLLRIDSRRLERVNE